MNTPVVIVFRGLWCQQTTFHLNAGHKDTEVGVKYNYILSLTSAPDVDCG